MKNKKRQPAPTPVRLDRGLILRMNKLIRSGLAESRSDIIRRGTELMVEDLEMAKKPEGK
jgi:Arc/MetJ-type ribon-helix-helix transcriptional regulator